MIAMPPIIAQLARDRELSGRAMQIWVISIGHLDFVEFRPLPLAQLVEEFNASRRVAPDPVDVNAVSASAVCRGLRRLVACGYLERAEHRGRRRESLYRLPLARIYPRAIA